MSREDGAVLEERGLRSDRTQSVGAAGRAMELAIAEWPLGVVLGLFLVLALAYSMRVPLYEAPDEWAHALYVESLAFDYELPDPEITHQAQHPPLYYAVEAVTVRLLGLSRPELPPPNPAFNQSPAEADMYLHPDEGFPWRGPVASVQVMRAVTVLFGLGLIVMTYLIAQLLFPERRWLAVSAAGTAAFVPQFVFISAAINNDVPAGFFASVCVYAAFRSLRQPDARWLILSAVFAGLAALTKSAAAVVIVVPVAVVFFAYPQWRERLRWLVLVAGVPLLVAGWFYLRNLIVWGNIFIPDDVIPLSGRGLGDPIYRIEFYDQLLDSYWYRGGWMNIRFTPLAYRFLAWVPAFAAAGIVVAFRRHALEQFQSRGLLLLLALPTLILLAIIQYSVMQDWGPQGRYFFPAQSAIAILLAFGVASVLSRDGNPDHPGALALPTVLLLMNVWVLAVKLPSVY